MNNQTARSKSTWEIVHSQLKQKKFTFIDWVAYWRGQYGCSSPSTKVLHDVANTFSLSQNLTYRGTEQKFIVGSYTLIMITVCPNVVSFQRDRCQPQGVISWF